MADPEYARLNTGVSITHGNSVNGVPLTHGPEQGKENAGQIADARTSRSRSGNDRYQFCTSRRLRRNTIRERIGMKICVVTHTRPGTVFLAGLRHTVFFTGGKVVP